jgi:hypothetical protein
MSLKELIIELSNEQYKYHAGARYKLQLKYGGRKYFNAESSNYHELKAFMYNLKRCDNYLAEHRMLDSVTKQPLQLTLFKDFSIKRKQIKRFVIFIKGTALKATYNDTVIPEFSTLRAALAFQKVLLGNTTDTEIKVIKYLSKPK